MKLSIIIAAYNIEDYIERCLSSISLQTNVNYEVIVVNDGSTDQTLKKIQDYISGNDKFKLINQKNKGLIETRKIGLEYANGEYIYFLDGDDWIEKTMVETVLKESRNNFDVLLFHSNICYENGKKKFYSLYKESKEINLDIEDVLLGRVLPAIWGKVIKKSYIEKNRIQFMNSVTYAEDLAITAELFVYGPIVRCINNSLHNYFVRGTSITNTVNDKLYDIYEVVKYVEEIVQLNHGNLYDKQLEFLYTSKLKQAYFLSIANKEIRRNILKQFSQKELKYRKQKIKKTSGKKEIMYSSIIITLKKIRSILSV